MNSEQPSGINLDSVLTSVRPQDDLYRHVNGRWLEDHVIPDDRSVDGAFHALRDLSEERVRVLVEEASPTTRIGALYASFMDAESVNASGVSVLDRDLAPIRQATDHTSLAKAMGKISRTALPSLVEFFVDSDAKNSSRYIVHLTQSGLGLPDESYYREEKYGSIFLEYQDHISRMLFLTGIAGGPLSVVEVGNNPGIHPLSSDESQRGRWELMALAGRIANQIAQLEQRISASHWDVVSRRDAEKSYNPMTLAELTQRYPGFPWQEWVSGITQNNEEFHQGFSSLIACQPSFLEGAAEIWTSTDLDTLKQWLAWGVVRARASLLTDELSQAHFEFYGQTLSGTPSLRPRWKRGISVVESLIGEDVGKEFVSRHFPPAHKARIDELISNLIAAYRESINTLEWMTPETKRQALIKLDKFRPKVGYPDKWRNFSMLHLHADDLLGNVRSASAFNCEYELGKLAYPVDRDEWHMTPQTVNAYFNPTMNEIVFPAAILQPPFFDADIDDAANYGGIGAVIGHEIGHGFDDQGSKFDGDGNLHNWWTDDDRRAFERRTSVLVAQYNELTPEGLDPKLYHVNGAFTLGENIGDLGGLSIALKAYRKSLAVRGITDISEAPVLDGLTALQRVFINWAEIWRTAIRQEEAIQRLATDPHSPSEFRCNQIVRNIDDFYTAFSVLDNDVSWLPPEERVQIW